ncbi:Polyadenylate-binding protein-interacting protein 11 [Heracleum sosnowskyi]|uniref:Polyadenylate-binding protein-interacting protein 11 n=1 Tax=Heracleum sosnowskyi TaxID=360622 RepID=A0AAD8MBS3_9APIA|nr:Polyadenylate-binding protein-interacting protein 11 [Heracleum sosnowskyi]
MAFNKSSECDADKSLHQTGSVVGINQSKSSSAENFRLWLSDQSDLVKKMSNDSAVTEQKGYFMGLSRGVTHHHQMNVMNDSRMNNYHDYDGGEELEREMRELEELLSNLNPIAQDYVPPNNARPLLPNSAPYFDYVADGNTFVPTDSPVAAGTNFVTQNIVPRAHHHQMNVGNNLRMKNHHDDDGGEGFERDVRDFKRMLSNLNPMAQGFVRPMVANNIRRVLPNTGPYFAYVADGNTSVPPNPPVAVGGNFATQKQIGSSQGKGRENERTIMAQKEDVIRRTVYVLDIDNQVTEKQLADLFSSCGKLVEVRLCGDLNSILRFAFVEFTDEEGARNALSLAGTMLRCHPVKVMPSKTAIAPVNPALLPRSEDERERCTRTICCTNIDKKVTRKDIKHFFQSFCGEVVCMRLLGDEHHSTHIAFVEFTTAESAIAAHNCSGVVMGSFPIRINPSKTPVRPRSRSAKKTSGITFKSERKVF